MSDRRERYMRSIHQWFEQFHDNTGEYPTQVAVFLAPDARYYALCEEPIEPAPYDYANPPEWAVRKFDSGFGCAESPAFVAWSENYVLFPATYDGAEWLDWKPRNPSPVIPQHVGGG
jgi:hypothetical protein